MANKAGATHSETIKGKDATFTALDWFPHVNRSGHAVVVLRWRGECDLCGFQWEATSAAGKAKQPSPFRCRGCK